MAYPTSIDTFPGTAAQGTSNLISPDHALDHRTIGSAVSALENKVGIGSGSAAANFLLVGTALGTSNWQQTWNNGTLGTATIGTSLITGGTINNAVIGTPAITGGTATSQTLSSPTIQTYDGWTSSADTYTYVSASSFKITGVDRTATYTKGTRVKFTNNSTTFYGVVISSSFSSDTTVSLAPNNDYSINNSAITNPFYSYQLSPQGYPGWFNYTVSYTGFSANPSGGVGLFKVDGNTCHYIFGPTSPGTSNSGAFTVSLPVTSVNNASYQLDSSAQVMDNGAFGTNPGLLEIAGASKTTLTIAKDLSGSGFTSSGNKSARGYIIYQI